MLEFNLVVVRVVIMVNRLFGGRICVWVAVKMVRMVSEALGGRISLGGEGGDLLRLCLVLGLLDSSIVVVVMVVLVVKKLIKIVIRLLISR